MGARPTTATGSSSTSRALHRRGSSQGRLNSMSPLARDRAAVPEIELLDDGDADAVRVVLVGIELVFTQVHRAHERKAVGQLDVTETLVAPENSFRGPGQIEVLHLPRTVVAPHTSGDESER